MVEGLARDLDWSGVSATMHNTVAYVLHMALLERSILLEIGEEVCECGLVVADLVIVYFFVLLCCLRRNT